jgi:putrescine transport system ATP-binding protein
MTALIHIDGVGKRFGAVTAVDDVTLDVGDNECVALLGASGCGKTTLLRLIAGLEHPDAGRILIDGRDMTQAPPYARPVNMMFQSYALFPHMSVADNVAFGLKQEGVAGAALTARVAQALAAVELDELGSRKPQQLSGGQRQRVALARCLAKQPRVLLLDEPLAALDKHLRARTQRELLSLRKSLGISFVIVTHDQSEAMAMADRIVVMDKGRVLQVASPRALYETPASVAVARFFGDVNMWDGAAITARSMRVPVLGIDLAVAMDTSPGRNVTVAIRPERIRFAPPGAGLMQGVVQEVTYMGSSIVVLVAAAQSTLRVALAGGEAIPACNATVHLLWSPHDVMVLAS